MRLNKWVKVISIARAEKEEAEDASKNRSARTGRYRNTNRSEKCEPESAYEPEQGNEQRERGASPAPSLRGD